MVWHSSIGHIKVVNMEDSHLINAIKFLQRRAFQEHSNAVVRAAANPFSYSGVNLQDLARADFEASVAPIYYAMVKEAQLRSLIFPSGPDVPVPPYEEAIKEEL